MNKRIAELEDSSSEDEDDIKVKRVFEKKTPYKRKKAHDKRNLQFSPKASTSSSYTGTPRGRPISKKLPKLSDDERPLKKPKKQPAKPKTPEPRKEPIKKRSSEA